MTDTWPDLARLPQPVFHRDELARLQAAKATPVRYADVAAIKRYFRGAWVMAAFRPRRPRKPKSYFFRSPVRAVIPLPLEDEEAL